MTWRLLPLLLVSGCGLLARGPAPDARPHYVVGSAYQIGGTWYYPQEDFRYAMTGLAEILPAQGGVTANGEVRDARAIAAAHQTLQLPAIAKVTNLETGLQLDLRINDRGPASPARLIGLSPRAAALLGMQPGTVAQVSVQVQDGASQALRDSLGGRTLQVSAAPRSAVAAESLAPPAGTSQSARGRVAPTGQVRQPDDPVAAATAAVLSDVAQPGPATPGQLFIRAGQFSQAAYASQVQAKLYGLNPAVEAVRSGRSQTFRVRAGPFPTVAQADAALDQAMRAGVTDARIVVE